MEWSGLSFSSKFSFGSYVSFVKTVPKKIGVLIRSVHEILLLCLGCYLDMRGELQKWMCRAAGSTLLLLLNPWFIAEMWSH